MIFDKKTLLHYAAAAVPGAVIGDYAAPYNAASGRYDIILVAGLVSMAATVPLIGGQEGRLGLRGAELICFGAGYFGARIVGVALVPCVGVGLATAVLGHYLYQPNMLDLKALRRTGIDGLLVTESHQIMTRQNGQCCGQVH